MSKTQIIVLSITIFVSVYLLSLLIRLEITKKRNKPSPAPKEEKVAEPPPIEMKKEEEPPVLEKKVIEEKIETPPISIALQDELQEFQEYLKERMTSKPSTSKNSYDTPKFSALDNYTYSNYDDYMDEFSTKRTKRRTNLEQLPNDVKALLFSDFFDTKF